MTAEEIAPTSVAAVQMVSTQNPDANLRSAEQLVAEAARQGARLVVLPENFALMHGDETAKVRIGETAGEGVLQSFLGDLARRHQIYLAGGTVPLRSAQAHKIRSACLLFDPRGTCLARYDKMHLFDVNIDSGQTAPEQYRESNTIEPGDQVVVVNTPVGAIGLAICYDLRFAELFRLLVRKGAEIILLPSAFTWTTGRAHWEVLVRARAMETQCYLVAPNQGGQHENGRTTWGHSMIVDPWGEVLAVRGEPGQGIVSSLIDRAYLRQLRSRFPVLRHQRLGLQSDASDE